MKNSFHSFEEVNHFLNSIPMFGQTGSLAANFNLNRMKRFCTEMGNPQKKFRSVHVAGTNGKGTVCRMLASVYQQSGYKTGIYTSPHLTDIRERFRINGSEIEIDSMILFFNTFGTHIAEFRYTYFEITTAIAFWYFAKEKVDIAMIETGLGGRLDATNVIDPELSIITSIGLDHTDLLGNTLGSIAFEKGGIIKEGKPVVTGNLPVEAETVIKKIVLKKNSNILKASDCEPVFENGKVKLKGVYPPVEIENCLQRKTDAVNTAMVFQAVDLLSGILPVTKDDFVRGIQQMSTIFSKTGTFEALIPGKKWYFDGGHNSEAVHYITEQMLQIAPPEKWTVVLSFMTDKLNQEIADSWNQFPELYLFQLDSVRAASIEQMTPFFPEASIITGEGVTALNQFKTELVIFSGSFYFYNTVSKWMGTMVASENKSFRRR